jgi:hypothetical protein
MIGVDYGVLNQKGSPSWFSDIYANIPTAGYKGRMFISIDTYAFYRDTGTGWDLIGGPGTGTITGSGTSGQVSYFNGSSTLAGSNNLFWDNTNSRLGIGTITPGQALDIHSSNNTLIQLNNVTTANTNIAFQNQDVTKWRIGNVYNGGANSFDLYNNTTTSTIFSVNSNNTFTFSTSVFANFGIALKDVTGINSNGNLGLGSTGAGLSLGMNVTTTNYFVLPTSVGYSYTFPATTGTIALTSNLSSYLPLTGGTLSGNLNITSSPRTTIYSETGMTFSGIGGSVSFLNVNNGADAGNVLIKSGTNSPYVSSILVTGNYADIANPNTNPGTIIFTTASTERMRILSNGNIGINTTTTIGKLDINTGANSNIVISNDSTDTGYNIVSLNGSRTKGSYAGIVGGGTGDGNLYLNSGSSVVVQTGASFTQRIKITSGGNLLIGTNTDNGNKLQVNGNMNCLATFRISDEATYGLTLSGVSSGNTIYSDGGQALKLGAGGVSFLTLAGSGSATFSSLGTGTVTATSGTLSTVSDMNLKIEDGYIDNALLKILNLKPRYFYWKNESGLPTNLRQLGFYAQEVNKALGEEAANTPKNENDNWGIYDRGLIAFLTKAIQELNEKLVRNNIN